MTGRLIAVLLLALGLAAGYGGVELGWSLVDYGPEADWLNEINRKQKGADTVNPSRPILWLGGHGGGHAGPVTIGGRGGVAMPWPR